MQRLSELIRTSSLTATAAAAGSTLLRRGPRATPHPPAFWLLAERRATVCSVCSSLIRRARQQHSLGKHLADSGRLQAELHLREQLLLLPVVGRQQHNTTQASSSSSSSSSETSVPPSSGKKKDQIYDHAHWGYTGEHGVAHWAEKFPACGGTSQSPVNVATADTVFSSKLSPFTFVNFDQAYSVDWVLQNNGHSAQVTYLDGDLFTLGGGLGNKFKVEQFHFHWGANDSVGSEHTVDNKPFPMEMHVVMYNTKYVDFGTAAGQPDGLAVLGSFFKVDSANNTNFDSLIQAVGEVQYPGAQISFPAVTLESLLPFTDEFVRYSGSLTTPPCSEVVTWTLFRSPIPISSSQLSVFRTLKSSEMGPDGNEPLVNNFRPTQPLNGRVINRNYKI